MLINSKIYIILYFSIIFINTEELLRVCEKYEENGEFSQQCRSQQSHFSRKRYIFYDVNHPEGFNLRRDVYVRVANFIKQLSEEDEQYQWNLVLPPWGHLYHWRSHELGSQFQIPWSTFFDIESLKKYVPVLEMYEFINEYPSENGRTILDQVYILKNDETMFKTGKFVDKNIIIPCNNDNSYKRKTDKQFTGFFWGYANITAYKVDCVTFHGTTFDLKKNLKPDLLRTVKFDHMEIPLHYSYGSVDYWVARRSMRYNSQLYEIANEFRLIYLNSNDIDDNTQKPNNWRLEKSKRNAIGGPFLAVHLRRQDFIFGHPESVPSIEDAATQIKKTLKLLNLDTVFIATDAIEEEYIQLKNQLKDCAVFRFLPTEAVKKKFKDGGVSIIDQIICSHARYFIGTHESTFTFRIQEDREILGFPASTTFNSLCLKGNKCPISSKWEIVWS